MGGATIQNPFIWDVGKLTLKFSGTPKETTSEEREYRNKPKPEIQVRQTSLIRSHDEYKSNSNTKYGIC